MARANVHPAPWRLFQALVTALMFGLFVWVLYWTLLVMPIVYESRHSGCVSVDDPSGRYNCERLPRKYHHVWVP